MNSKHNQKFQIPYDRRGAYDADWCYDCERLKEDCVCEELSDHFREIQKAAASPDADVCVPAASGPPSFPNFSSVPTDKVPITTATLGEDQRQMRNLPESFEDWLKQNNDSIEIGT